MSTPGWNNLSSEIWARVFSILAPEAAEAAARLQLLDEGELEIWSCYQELRLVSKAFNAIFRRNPGLSGLLHLGHGFSLEALSSFLVWVQHSAFEAVLAECDAHMAEVALAALAAFANRVASVELHNISASGITVLTAFTFLSHCKLHGDLDLDPLQHLQRLTSLSLVEGQFDNLGKLAHLTSLRMCDAQDHSNQDCEFTSSLQKLHMERGILHNLHALGLSACTSLRSLDCEMGEVAADRAEDWLDIWGSPLRLPSILSTLTQLTKLNLRVESQVEGICDITWLYALTNLKRLELSFRSGSAVVQLHNTLTALVNLTILSMSIRDPGSMVSLDVTWDALPLLKAVHVSCARLHLTERILSLTQMPDLACLRIFTLGIVDGMSMQYFGVLTYGMALECPGVRCIFGPGCWPVAQLLSEFKTKAIADRHTV